jgi:hypothetical protein
VVGYGKEDTVPETLTDQQRHAHARATRQGIAATAADLQELFGQRLVAVIAGVKDAKAVGRWARGEDVPRAQAAATLQNALHVVELLRSQEDDETIRSWFRGMNPDLGDRSPALVVRDKPENVVQAARAFLAQ